MRVNPVPVTQSWPEVEVWLPWFIFTRSAHGNSSWIRNAWSGGGNRPVGMQFCPWCPMFFLQPLFGHMLCFWRIYFTVPHSLAHFARVSIIQHLHHPYTPFRQDVFASFLQLSPLFNVALPYWLFIFFTVLLFLLELLVLLFSTLVAKLHCFWVICPNSPFSHKPHYLVHDFTQHMAFQEGVSTLWQKHLYLFLFS